MGSSSSTNRSRAPQASPSQSINLETRLSNARKENYYIMEPSKLQSIVSTAPEAASNVVHNAPQTPTTKIVVAKLDYQTSQATDLSFFKGDRMEVINDSDPGWWNVRHLKTGQQGFIPWNHVIKEGAVDNENWYFGKMTRVDSERLLLESGNVRGTFMVRKSEQNPNRYSLSVRDWEQRRGHHIKHYKIEKKNTGFYLNSTHCFQTVQSLIFSYSNNAQGICHVLLKPCPRPKPQIVDLRSSLENIKEINRNEVKLIKKLGQGNADEIWFGTWKNLEVIVRKMPSGTRLKVMNALCTTEEPIYIVQEYKQNKAFVGYLKY